MAVVNKEIGYICSRESCLRESLHVGYEAIGGQIKCKQTFALFNPKQIFAVAKKAHPAFVIGKWNAIRNVQKEI